MTATPPSRRRFSTRDHHPFLYKSFDEILDSDLAPPRDYPALSGDESSSKPVRRPGTDRGSPTCGNMVKLHCDECGHEWDQPHNCMSRYCPVCYKLWADREARTAAGKCREKRRGTKLVHAVVSFPCDPDQVWWSRRYAYEIALRHGIVGGAVVPHAWREHEDGSWVQDGYVHYHIVGSLGAHGYFVPGQDTKGQYIFKVIKNRKGSYYLNDRVLYWRTKDGRPKGVLYYMLEHACVQHKRHALTWFGTWWRMDNGDEEPSLGGEKLELELECPKCHGRRVRLADRVVEHAKVRYQATWDTETAGWTVTRRVMR